MVFERFVRGNLKTDDAVMILHYGNDFDDNIRETNANAPYASLSETGEVVTSLPSPERWSSIVKQNLKDASYFYNYLAYVINYQKRLSDNRKEETKLAKQKENSKKDPTMIQDDRRITIMEYLLSEIQSECHNKEVPLFMIRVPYRNEFAESPPHQLTKLELRSSYRPTIHSITERLDIPFHDLSSPIVKWKQNNEDRLTFKYDAHWNEAGHQLAFDESRDFLTTFLLPASPSIPSGNHAETQITIETNENPLSRE